MISDPTKPKYGQKFINESNEKVTFIGFGDREREDWMFEREDGSFGISVMVGKRKVLDEFVFTDDQKKNQEFIDSLPAVQLLKKLEKDSD